SAYAQAHRILTPASETFRRSSPLFQINEGETPTHGREGGQKQRERLRKLCDSAPLRFVARWQDRDASSRRTAIRSKSNHPCATMEAAMKSVLFALMLAGASLADNAPKTAEVKDPVCSMTVDPKTAAA